jgi:hypothetical protein
VKNLEKKVNWDFKISISGYGRNCKEALIAAAENLLYQIDSDFCPGDFEKIETHEVIHVDETGEMYGFEELE